MPYGYSTDAEIDDSTDRMMLVGVALFIVLIAAFPLYLLYEPGAREDARQLQLDSLIEEGATVW